MLVLSNNPALNLSNKVYIKVIIWFTFSISKLYELPNSIKTSIIGSIKALGEAFLILVAKLFFTV